MLPNPGPFVARRRWPSLSSSFPGREGDGVWDCGGVCHSDRGGGVGDHSSATAGRNGSAPVSVGEEAIGSAMNSSSVAQHRVNGRMQVGEKGKRCGEGGDKPGQPAVCIYVHWTGLDWRLALNVAGKIACILLLVETDRQTSSAHHPSSLFLLSGCVCVCFSLSLTDALLSHRLTVQVRKTNSKQAGLF